MMKLFISHRYSLLNGSDFVLYNKDIVTSWVGQYLTGLLRRLLGLVNLCNLLSCCSLASTGLAGIQPADVPGIENVGFSILFPYSYPWPSVVYLSSDLYLCSFPGWCDASCWRPCFIYFNDGTNFGTAWARELQSCLERSVNTGPHDENTSKT